MTIVPTPGEIVRADDGVSRPSMSSGSAHSLPMTEEQMAEVAKRPKLPFGFVKPTESKGGKA